jgi:hypothetical protein
MAKGTTSKLNPKQEQFCQLYASDREFFGNGVESYIEVYKPDTSKMGWYNSACSSASRLLRSVKVCERINEILEVNGLNDQAVDKQLSFLVTQHADFGAKLGAIREYNKLKKRVTDRMEHTGKDSRPIDIKAVEVMDVGDDNQPETSADR